MYILIFFRLKSSSGVDGIKASEVSEDAIKANQVSVEGQFEEVEVPALMEQNIDKEVQDGEQESPVDSNQVSEENSVIPSTKAEPGMAQVQDGGHESAFPKGNESHWLEYAVLMGNTLPSKSKITYLKAYSDLETYLRKENQFVQGVIPSEHALLNYFFYLKNIRQLAPSTIWYFSVSALLKSFIKSCVLRVGQELCPPLHFFAISVIFDCCKQSLTRL